MSDAPTGNALPDWPVGPFLQQAREQAKLSLAQVARASGLSESKVRQLERGWSLQSGVKVHVGTRKSTVEEVARAVGADVNRALELAGFMPIHPRPVRQDLTHVSDDDLLAELARRLAMRGYRKKQP